MTIKKTWEQKVPFLPLYLSRSKTLRPGHTEELWTSVGYNPDDWRQEARVPYVLKVLSPDSIRISRALDEDIPGRDYSSVLVKQEINNPVNGPDASLLQGRTRSYGAIINEGRVYNFHWEQKLPNRARR